MKKILIISFAILVLIGLLGNAFAQSLDEALSLYKQGQEVAKQSRYQEALSYFEKSLEIFKKLNHLQGISANMNNIGFVYASLGQYEKAIVKYEESLKIRKELNIPQDIATSLNNIGSVYERIGPYEKALIKYEEALKIYKELNIPQNIATCLHNISRIYISLQQYEKALVNFEEALKIYKELNIPQEIATSLHNIGGVYASHGQYEKALIKYEEALKIYKKLNLPQYIAGSLNGIGDVYAKIGQYEKALANLEEALKIRRELNSTGHIAESLNNIGFVYTDIGQYDKALVKLEEALKIVKGLNISENIVTSLNNIGSVYLIQRKYKKAWEKFFESAKEEEKAGIKRINAGFVPIYISIGMYNEALRLLEKMTPKWNTGNSYRIQFHTQRGLALKGMDNFKDASSDFIRAVLLTEEMRQKVKGEKSGFLSYGGAGGRIRAYKGLVTSLSERAITGETIDSAFANYGKDIPSNAFYFAESTKARTLLESIAESARKYNEQELPLSLSSKEQDILNQLSAIEEHWEETYKKGEQAFKELQERKENLKKELDSLIAEIRKDYPRYSALKYPRPILAEELPLKDNEVLLEYAIDDKAAYLFKVKKGGVQKIIKIAKGKEELEAQINEFILPLQSQYTREDFSAEKGHELYSLLLAEALKDETPDKNIIIVPDGILGLLPFEILVEKAGKDYKDSQYIGDKWKITYAQSASVLALNRMLKPVEAAKSLFALGNPVYDKDDPRYLVYLKKEENPPIPPLLKGGDGGLLAQNLKQYAYRGLATRREWGKTTQDDKEGEDIIYIPLPETETEVKAITKLFNIKPTPPDVLLNIDASETKLRETKLKEYKYLHFATHSDLPGKVQGINEPFILLGQVENKEGDDGFLTLTEVLELKLDADMVVLSACLTGRGKVMEGEGVANFARAFHHAGARSVVVSLWEVASEEAVEYMKTFYTHLKQGKGRAEALRLTRQAIQAKYPNPFYWAPFILHGER